MKFLEAFENGIRRSTRQAPNTQALISATNLRARVGEGLTPFVDITQSISSGTLSGASVTPAWPWPQLFRGNGITLLADKNALFSVDTSTWALTAITVYDWTTYNYDADTASSDTIPTGTLAWRFVDLWDSWMLFNGTCVIFKTPFSSKVFLQDSVTIYTGATYNDGRLFYGGFDPSDFFSLAAWNTYLAGYDDELPAELSVLSRNTGLDANWVWWSTPGAPDAWWLYSLPFMKYGSLKATPTGHFTDDMPYWRQLWETKTAGAAVMPFSGSVHHIKQLGPYMICYGTNGVAALQPIDDHRAFGLVEIPGMDRGIGANINSVGGNEEVHAFVDEVGDVWVIDANLKAERLEYRQLFAAMIAANDVITVQYDPRNQEFWIGKSTESYVLSLKGGMTRAPMNTAGLCEFGGTEGVVFASSVPTAASFQTEWFDGGMGRVPQILSVRLLGSSGWTLTPKFKRTPTDSEQTGTAVAVDGRNVCDFHTSGTIFSISGSHADRTVAKVRELEVEMDNGERRRLRPWLT